MAAKRYTAIALSIALGLATMALLVRLVVVAAQTDILGSPGSGQFGRTVMVLPNGNIVVTDPGYDAPGPVADVGAVYLYDGATDTLISQLTGSTAFDQAGSGSVVTLTNGNYVVRSPDWDNGADADAGAVTWGEDSARTTVGPVTANTACAAWRPTAGRAWSLPMTTPTAGWSSAVRRTISSPCLSSTTASTCRW